MAEALRIKELDFLKSIFIILMVMFHLVYFSEKYPYLKQIVYTFHMSGFLIISGYLLNYKKTLPDFGRKILWLTIPYLIMESGYVIMAFIFPIREHLSEINLTIILNKVFLHPLGPYWYIHTIILCEVFFYLVCRIIKENIYLRFILSGLILYILSLPPIQLLSFSNAIYFMIGAIIQQSNLSFKNIFKASCFSLLPFIILCFYQSNLDRASLGGVTITYLIISILLYSYKILPQKVETLFSFIGRNTFIILLFSPIFTLLSKSFIPVFSFDPSAICFMIFAVIFTLLGCFAIARFMDFIGLSRYFFGKKKVISDRISDPQPVIFQAAEDFLPVEEK